MCLKAGMRSVMIILLAGGAGLHAQFPAKFQSKQIGKPVMLAGVTLKITDGILIDAEGK